jgi:hypothetical protein
MLGPKGMTFAGMTFVIISLLTFGQESIDAVTQSIPLCIFTILGGLLLMWRGPHALYQLMGVLMVTSPFWLLPTFDRVVSMIVEVI